MCSLQYRGAEKIWVVDDEEFATGPVLRHSAVAVHCGLRMAVTETHLHCRNPKCRLAEFRWKYFQPVATP